MSDSESDFPDYESESKESFEDICYIPSPYFTKTLLSSSDGEYLYTLEEDEQKKISFNRRIFYREKTWDFQEKFSPKCMYASEINLYIGTSSNVLKYIVGRRDLNKEAEYAGGAKCIAVYEKSIYIAQGSKIIRLSTDLKEISSFQTQGQVLQLIVSSLGIAVRSQESIQLFDFQYKLVWKLKDTFRSMAEFEGKLFTLQSAQEVWSWDKQIYTRCFRTRGADTLIALKGKIIVGADKLQVWRNEESGYQHSFDLDRQSSSNIFGMNNGFLVEHGKSVCFYNLPARDWVQEAEDYFNMPHKEIQALQKLNSDVVGVIAGFTHTASQLLEDYENLTVRPSGYQLLLEKLEADEQAERAKQARGEQAAPPAPSLTSLPPPQTGDPSTPGNPATHSISLRF